MSGDRVVVDTNVLLAATAPYRSLHRQALTVLNSWPNLGWRLCASGQILREYLVVATRPLGGNGLGLATRDALTNVVALADRMRLLDEDGQVSVRLRDLVSETGCTGARIHDANVAATALAHGVRRIVTANVADFQGFEPRIEVHDLAGVGDDSTS
jgi:predicted nucleic acid-binding protein